MITKFKLFEKMKNPMFSFIYEGFDIDILFESLREFHLYIDEEYFGKINRETPYTIEYREDIKDLNFLFDTKKFEKELFKRLLLDEYNIHNVYQELINKYGKNVSDILIDEIKNLRDSVKPMDGYGITAVYKKGDIEDEKNYNKKIDIVCDATATYNIEIDGDTYHILIEYE